MSKSKLSPFGDYFVGSFVDEDVEYKVTIEEFPEEKPHACTCPHFEKRGGDANQGFTCKHIRHVLEAIEEGE